MRFRFAGRGSPRPLTNFAFAGRTLRMQTLSLLLSVLPPILATLSGLSLAQAPLPRTDSESSLGTAGAKANLRLSPGRHLLLLLLRHIIQDRDSWSQRRASSTDSLPSVRLLQIQSRRIRRQKPPRSGSRRGRTPRDALLIPLIATLYHRSLTRAIRTGAA